MIRKKIWQIYIGKSVIYFRKNKNIHFSFLLFQEKVIVFLFSLVNCALVIMSHLLFSQVPRALETWKEWIIRSHLSSIVKTFYRFPDGIFNINISLYLNWLFLLILTLKPINWCSSCNRICCNKLFMVVDWIIYLL